MKPDSHMPAGKLIRVGLRLVLPGACYVIASATKIDHFLYTILKGGYATYQIIFYVSLFFLSLMIAPPQRSPLSRKLVLPLGPVLGYASGLIAFFLLPLSRGAGASQIFNVRDISGILFLSPLFSFGWLVGFYFALLIVFFTPGGRFRQELF